MKYWLVKSEPDTYSFQQMQADNITRWDGVRNFQARNFMKEMRIGDQCMFYHSGKERSVVGIVEVAKEFYPDPTDKTGKFGMVDMKFAKAIKNPVTLALIKSIPQLSDLLLVRQSRLSVMPITPTQWSLINKLSI